MYAWKKAWVLGIVLFSLMLAGWARPASAQVLYVRVSWTQSTATATTVTISWNTASTGDPSVVEYGLDASYGSVAYGSVKQGKGELGAIHEVTLEGLDPDTTYHYHVGGQGTWSGDHTFHTGPGDTEGCAPFRFVAMGDGRSDGDYGPSQFWASILGEAAAKNPAFILLSGDQVRAGEDVPQWVHWLDESDEVSPSIPIMPSLGNHDDDNEPGDNAAYNQVFALPPNTVSGTEDFYYFTYGNAIFVSLSMMSYTGGSYPFEEQAQWLDQVLTDNPRTWKFVFFHHPMYTGTLGIQGLLELNHPPNELDQNAALAPVLDAHHVDMVFTGHNHHYQRFEPMCCGGGDTTGQVTGDFDTGTVHVVTGGAGALTYDLSALGLDIPALICLTSGSVTCSAKHHYIVVDIDGLDLHYQVFTTSAQLLSNSEDNVGLIDEFWIHKPGPAPTCDEPGTPDAGPEEAPDAPMEVAPEAGPEAGPELPPEVGPEPIAEVSPEPAGMVDAGGDAGSQEDASGTGEAGPSTGGDGASGVDGAAAQPVGDVGPAAGTETTGQVEPGGPVGDVATEGSAGGASSGGCVVGGAGHRGGLVLALLVLALFVSRRRSIRTTSRGA